MPINYYAKGRKKEYAIVKKLKELYWDIVVRTAGSHSPIDIIAINKKAKTILLIQSKPKNYPDSATNKLEEKYRWLWDDFHVRFEVR